MKKTELLTKVTVDQAVVAVVSAAGGDRLAEILENKGFGKVILAEHPRDTFTISRDGSIHVVVVCLASANDDEALLLRSLKEGSAPPQVLAIAEYSSLEREITERVPPEYRPDRMLVKPVPTVTLVHEIELQLTRRAVDGRPAGDTLPFAEVFADLWQGERTGVLRVMSEGLQTVVYFRGGRPLFAEGGTPADLLGRILVETKRIDEKQLSEAVELMTNRLVENEQLQMGAALVELGFITASELYETLTVQVRRKLSRCFGWRKVRAEFKEGDDHLEGITEFSTSPTALLMTGCEATPSDEVRVFLERREQLVLALEKDRREVEHTYRLGPKDRRIIDAVDGQTALGELVSSAADSDRAGRVMMALILGRAVGVTRPSQRAAPAVPAPAPDARTGQAKPGSKSIYGSARVVPMTEEEEEGDGLGDKVKSLLHKVKRRHDDE
jgi:hypothetical protein